MFKQNAKFQCLLSMVIFGTIPLVKKFIPCPSSVLALVRAVIGALFLLALMFLRREKPDFKAIRKNIVPLIICGVMLGFNWICLFEAYNTSVAVATVCYYMAPVIVILLSPLLFREKLGLKKGACAAISVLGMALTSGLFQNNVSGVQGILLGLAAAGMYASIVIMNKFIHDISAFDKTIVQLGIAAVSLLPYVLLTEDITALQLDASAIFMLLVAGVVHTGVAYALYFGSIKDIPAQTAALLSYIDPALAVLISAVILKEPATAVTFIGAALVIGAAMVSEIDFSRKDAQKT